MPACARGERHGRLGNAAVNAFKNPAPSYNPATHAGGVITANALPSCDLEFPAVAARLLRVGIAQQNGLLLVGRGVSFVAPGRGVRPRSQGSLMNQASLRP